MLLRVLDLGSSVHFETNVEFFVHIGTIKKHSILLAVFPRNHRLAHVTQQSRTWSYHVNSLDEQLSKRNRQEIIFAVLTKEGGVTFKLNPDVLRRSGICFIILVFCSKKIIKRSHLNCRYHTGRLSVWERRIIRPRNRLKLTDEQMDKVTRIIHQKLKPLRFQIKSYYPSSANYPVDNPSLVWKRPIPC